MGGAYLEDEAVGAGTVILVHLVDDQEDDTGEEGQGKEHQHGHLWAGAGPSAGLRGGHADTPTHRCTQTHTQARGRLYTGTISGRRHGTQNWQASGDERSAESLYTGQLFVPSSFFHHKHASPSF